MQTEILTSADLHLAMLFMDGDLRKMNLYGKEVLQRVYFTVRDEAWLNIPYTIINSVVKRTAEGMHCSYNMLFKNEQIDFIVSISYMVENHTVTMEAKGKANTDFWKNRIGFCLHIPVMAKGAVCKVEHADDTITEGVLPVTISPHQPFRNIRSICWNTDSETLNLEFSGDVFEMEDQRNWTDASYKIYSTPLDLPFPVQIKKGEFFYQKIRFSAVRNIKSITLEKKVEEQENRMLLPWPSIGFTDKTILSPNASSAFQSISQVFTHCRIDVLLSEKDWKMHLRAKYEQLKELSVPFQLVLYFTNDYKSEIADFIAYIQLIFSDISFHSFVLLSVNGFVLTDAVVDFLSSGLRKHFEHVTIGGGTDANFAQLNRNRPASNLLDFLCYSIQPQEHASDRMSIVENIQGQADTVKTATSFSNGKEISISVLSFYRRFNANLHFISSDKSVNHYTYQHTALECGWFIGSIYQLIRSGIKSVTLEWNFDNKAPLTVFFQFLADSKPEYFYDMGNDKPDKYAYLAWLSKGRRYAVFVNLTDSVLTIDHPLLHSVLAPGECVFI